MAGGLRRQISRRSFVKALAVAGAQGAFAGEFRPLRGRPFFGGMKTPLFVVRDVPVPNPSARHHDGVDALLDLLGFQGRKLYQSVRRTPLSGPRGMIRSDDIVLVKVNAQWKYKGCTNSDVVKGVIQRILEHPDGFRGEIVVFENGQGVGRLDCTSAPRWGNYPDLGQHANAEDESQSFSYLVNTVFAGNPVSEYTLDTICRRFIDADDHVSDGYRKIDNVSYPCFTTAGGNRVELREGLWNGNAYEDRLKLINIPVLKGHGGCGMTGALKHFYGILTMQDGRYAVRHIDQFGNDCADMWFQVKTPALTILDCIWVSPYWLSGYPVEASIRTNTLVAGFDPVALDYWASKYVLHAASGYWYVDPDASEELIAFLSQARDRINSVHGGVEGRYATMDERWMHVNEVSLGDSGEDGLPDASGDALGLNADNSDSDADAIPEKALPAAGSLATGVTAGALLATGLYAACTKDRPKADRCPMAALYENAQPEHEGEGSERKPGTDTSGRE